MAESNKSEEPEAKANSDDGEVQQITMLSRLMNQFSELMGGTDPPAVDPVLKSFDLTGVADFMRTCSNIVVMAGAGISTSAGIPDFRSPDTGLYSQLEKYNLPFPEAVFHLEFFRTNPKPFFLLAKELYPQKFTPTPTHYFLRLLSEKNKLLRIFTQNIDALERVAGIPPEKIVEAHGTFFTSHCLKCKKEYDLEFVKEIIFDDQIPHCTECDGIVKPDIVFFGESLPERFRKCVATDFDKADLLIIVGTSLKVAPFNHLLRFVDKNCPRLLINMEPAGNATSILETETGALLFNWKKNRRDVFHQSACDDGVTELAKLLGWEDDFKQLLQSEAASRSEESKNHSVSLAETEANADRLAEQIAKATLNTDNKKD